MKLGDLEFHVLNAGHVYLDGGAMFGVVPKALWEKKCPADARNRIQLAMNCILVHAGGKNILIETGAGDKFSAKFRDIYGLDGPFLARELRRHGRELHEIDIVINTHLHFDHCGGNTHIEKDKVVPTFPHARYAVQRGEFEHALHPNERDSASYIPDNYVPTRSACKLSLLEGDRTIAPGVDLIKVPGHTSNMQCVKLHGGGKTAFLLADLVPTAAHLPLPWIMGYDLYPMTTLENRKKWIPEIIREGWIALFGHDPRTPAAYLRERDGHWEAEPVKIT
ncbi:MAG TPA: MBL fold metallo-hydrolase [Verrucomicrobiae bacterium]|nr:MBL fold metallo-hydrolase [Verrucomicrobiae bacterium]